MLPEESIFKHAEPPLVETVEIGPEHRIAVLSEKRGLGADRFRYIRMCLRELRAQGKLKTIAITSALPQDGKSTVAANLATVLAEGGKCPVLLIEADLHHPSLAGMFGLSVGPGLSECMEDGIDPFSVMRRLEPLNWLLLSAGNPEGNPTELLQSSAFPAVLEKLVPHFEWILIDTPPVLPLSDPLAVSKQSDATLLVVRAHSTPCEAVNDAVSLLGTNKIVGIVLNAAEDLHRLYSKYSYYYGKK